MSSLSWGTRSKALAKSKKMERTVTVRSSALPMSNSTCAIAPIVLRPGRNPFCLFVIQMAAVLKMMYLMEREWREVDESRGGGGESSRRGPPVCVSVCYKPKTFAAGGLLQEEEEERKKNPWPSVLGGLPSFFFSFTYYLIYPSLFLLFL